MKSGRAFYVWRVLGIICLIMAVVFPVEMPKAVSKEEAQGLLKGIDVSFYNGDVDYKKVKESGFDYVMIRTGSGTDIVDDKFSVNYGNAGQQSLKRGVYHYCKAVTVEEAKKEAKACLSVLDKRNLECPIAYDIEEDKTFKTGQENVTALAVAFCEEVKAAGYEPMIYASLNKLQEYFDYDQISQYKIWIANYDVDYPNFGSPYYMWQYKIGSVDGANTGSGECDVNYVYEDFFEPAGITLDQEKLDFQLGEGLINKGNLSAKVDDMASNKHVNWTSKNEKVATVDASGNVIGVGNGTTDIIASTVNGIEASCKVTVTTPSTAISIANPDLTIGKKETIALIPALTPEDSTDHTNYTSCDSSVITVNKDGTITGKKKGSAQITATTDSGVSTTVTVTVKKSPWKLSKKSSTFKKMKVGESYSMGCKLPKGSASNKITYYSRNQYRVKVSDDGTVTALAEGWCLIRASTYNKKKTWTLVHVTK